VFKPRRVLEAALILAVIFGAQYWQTRGLAEGAAPPLAGVLTNGSPVKVGAGDTATLVAFWATWCPVCKAEEGNIVSVAKDHRVIPVAMQSGDAATVTKHLKAIDWGVRGVPTHFVVDGAGNIRFRVVGYATTWGLKARLWWAETFPA
jgi:thiol-disulfide isomerase/thioredoxin